MRNRSPFLLLTGNLISSLHWGLKFSLSGIPSSKQSQDFGRTQMHLVSDLQPQSTRNTPVVEQIRFVACHNKGDRHHGELGETQLEC